MRLIFCIVACPLILPAQDVTPASLLKDAAARIRNLDSYTVEFVRHDDSDHLNLVVHGRISFARPTRFHIEDVEPSVSSGRTCPRITDIMSGTLRWSFARDLKLYSKRTFDPQKEDPISQIAPPIRDVSQITLQPDETLLIGGRQYECTVIRSTHPNGAYLIAWIDKSRGYIVKYNVAAPRTRITVELISIEPNVALPDDLFTFDPPADWRQASGFPCHR